MRREERIKIRKRSKLAKTETREETGRSAPWSISHEERRVTRLERPLATPTYLRNLLSNFRRRPRNTELKFGNLAGK